MNQSTSDRISRPITADSHAALVQQLRRGVNALIGHCTDLAEDPAASRSGPSRLALDNALTIAKSMRATVNETLRRESAAVDTTAVDALYRQLHNMRVLVSDGLSEVIREASESGMNGLFVSELRAARDVALSLMSEEGTAVFQAPEVDVSERETVDSPFVIAPPTVVRTRPRALCADDTPISLKAIRAYLKHLDYEVVTAENGRLALDIAMANPGDFDVVITDLEMPEMTGFELLERLKASPVTHDIPVIVISGLDDAASVVKCIKNGAEDHLTKPFDEVLLGARVGAVVERKRLRDREVEYLRRVDRVTEAARAAEAGTYDSGALTEIARDADALGRLARVFDSMVSSVKEREKRLQERVQTLRQEVQTVRATTARGGGGDNPAAPVLASDSVFAGRYRIVKELGRGGMGMVYRAHDNELDEEVAIKTVHPGLLEADPALGERFKTEARLARSLAHPNVVRTYDFGQSGTIHYLTMEFVEGVTLREMIDTQGTLSVASTLAAGMQLAQALGVAHGAGIIHRDIKPENLLLDENGVLKVMDFGVARPVGGKRLTEAGFVVGTMSYMAPEHLFGQEIDARADLYAAGVVLYECLTGVLPIDAPNPYALAAKLSEEAPVPPQFRNSAVPQALSALVLRLLAKKRDSRPANAAELADRLREIQ